MTEKIESATAKALKHPEIWRTETKLTLCGPEDAYVRFWPYDRGGGWRDSATAWL